MVKPILQLPVADITINNMENIENLVLTIPDWIKVQMKDCVDNLEEWVHGVFLTFILNANKESQNLAWLEMQPLASSYATIHVDSDSEETNEITSSGVAHKTRCLIRLMKDVLEIKDLPIKVRDLRRF